MSLGLHRATLDLDPGEHLEFVGTDFTLPPGSVAPPPHVHPTFKSRSGEIVRVRNIHRPAVRFEYIYRLMKARRIADVNALAGLGGLLRLKITLETRRKSA